MKCVRIQFLFAVDFAAQMDFEPNIHRSQNLVDFLPLSMPFCTFGAKMQGTGKNHYYVYVILLLIHEAMYRPLH